MITMLVVITCLPSCWSTWQWVRGAEDRDGASSERHDLVGPQRPVGHLLQRGTARTRHEGVPRECPGIHTRAQQPTSPPWRITEVSIRSRW